MLTENRIAFAKRVLTVFVSLLGGIIFLYLSWESLRRTWLFELSYTQVQYVVEDSFFRHMLSLGAAMCFAGAFFRLMRRLAGKEEKKERLICTMLAVLSALFMFVLGFYWVSVCGISPHSDQGDVILAVEDIRNKNWSVFLPQGYLGKVHFQMGLAAVFHGIVSLTGAEEYIIVEYINVFCLPVLFLTLFAILRKLYDSRLTEILYSVLMASCLPLYIFTTLIYGEILSLTACLLMVGCVLYYLKTGKHIGVVLCLSVFCSVFGVLCRGNSWIFMIAAGIFLFLYGIRKRQWQCFLLIVCLMAAPLFANKALVRHYENLSGIAINEGIPNEAWIAMGMMDGGNLANGWYNFYNYRTYDRLGCDREALKKDSLEHIGKRLKEFGDGTQDWRSFYREKILSQWNDPSYCCFCSTYHFSEDTPEWVERAYDNGYLQGKLSDFQNEHQFIVYLGCLLAAGMAFLRRKEPFMHCIFEVIIIGGFLFSILWEASSRYVFPYYICMIPWAAWGLGSVFSAAAEKAAQRIKTK